ncbi:sodium/bile acid cotransporter [Hippoglossus hippoglossus]|uniref:sodium/bile acid cotransporter n=1 Tax=Hippoglossus hippoglossus TaxID=8267 RepID=UPI00148D3B41|nr:sodium/bile acid cotransporter [Hippoglossus hippoglossus]
MRHTRRGVWEVESPRRVVSLHIACASLDCWRVFTGGTSMEGIRDDAAHSWQNDSFLSFNTTAVSPGVDMALKTLTTTMVCILMLSLGCTMELPKIKAFQLTDIRALVILVCGCSPGGNLSNLLTLALLGDINLSMVMTACSMFLALGMMPLLLLIYCQGFPNLHEALPYVGIVISLSLLFIASGVGILINFYRPQDAKTVKKVGFTLALACYVAVLLIFAIEFSFWSLLSPPLVVSAALMPLIGYTVGYLISSLCRLSQPERRTVAMETGCQNVQLCSALLKVAFPPAVMGPLFLFPMVFAFFQLTEGAVIVGLFRCHRRFTQKKKGGTDAGVFKKGSLITRTAEEYEPAPTDDNTNALP